MGAAPVVADESGGGSATWSGFPGLETVPPGTVVRLQAYYDDASGPCGTQGNLTGALELRF